MRLENRSGFLLYRKTVQQNNTDAGAKREIARRADLGRGIGQQTGRRREHRSIDRKRPLFTRLHIHIDARDQVGPGIAWRTGRTEL